MKRWNVVSLPLERNTKDSRDESWKIQGSKTEWETLSDKIIVKRKLSRKEWVELITYLKENFDRQLGFVRNFFFKKGARVSLIDKAITFFEDDLFPLAAEAA